MTFHYLDENTNVLRIGTNNLASYVDAANNVIPVETAWKNIACDPKGSYLLTSITASQKGRSFDGGFSFSNIGNLPFIAGNWRFAFAGASGTESRWIAVGSYVYYTKDFWNSAPIDKRGNLFGITPFMLFDTVNVLP